MRTFSEIIAKKQSEEEAAMTVFIKHCLDEIETKLDDYFERADTEISFDIELPEKINCIDAAVRLQRALDELDVGLSITCSKPPLRVLHVRV